VDHSPCPHYSLCRVSWSIHPASGDLKDIGQLSSTSVQGMILLTRWTREALSLAPYAFLKFLDPVRIGRSWTLDSGFSAPD
jgi:hypothetical protein